MAKVYRIEHRLLKPDYRSVIYFGCYGTYDNSPVSSFDWTKRQHTERNGHPCPRDDFFGIGHTKFEWSDSYFCGFKTIKQLKQWFNKTERANLARFDFVIAIYETKKAYHARYQSVFQPKGERLKIREL